MRPAVLVAAVILVVAGGTRAASAVASAPPGPGPEAELEGLPIREVRIVTRDVFDPVPGGALRPLYRAANALHLRTRESAVRDLLLLAPGQPWHEVRRQESVRALRALDFLQPERITATGVGDSVDVVVETRDAWTTRPEFNLERGGGAQYGSVGLAEQNVLGWGKSLLLSYEEVPTGVSRRLAWSDPAVLGTRTRFEWAAGNGSAGSSDVLQLSLPFFAEDAPVTYGMAWRRSTSTARLFANAAEVASLARRLSETEVWFGRGQRRRSGVWRVTGSLLTRDRTLGPTRREPGAPPAFTGPEEQVAWRRLGAELRWWRPAFLEVVGVEAMDRVEDYDLGPSVAVFGGFAPKAFGSSADEGFARVKLGAGARTAVGFGWLHGSLETRLRRDARELVRRGEARWVIPTGEGHHLVLAGRSIGSSRPSRDFQVVFGGLSGLRAYPVHAVAGTDVVRLNVEERLTLARDVGRLLSLGGAAFLDAARGWGSGAEGTSWFTAAGVGLRFAPPRTAIGPVFRADVAWPVSPTRDGRREAVFSFGSSQGF